MSGRDMVSRRALRVLLLTALAAPAVSSAALAYNVWFGKEESDLPYTFNALSSSFTYYPQDQYMASRWNVYADVFRIFTQRYTPAFNNDRSDQVGLLSDSGYNSYFGESSGWGSGAAVTFRESFLLIPSDKYLDIAYNSTVSWTTSKTSAGQLFQGSALHELGHALGLHHNFYDMSVMNYGQPKAIDDHLMPDDVRYLYDSFPSYSLTVTDMGAWAYTASGYQVFAPATAAPSTVTGGGTLEVDGIYVGNLRNGSQAGAVVRFYLSPDTAITTSDHFIGTLTFSSSWPRATGQSYSNLSFTVPTSVPAGSYYVGMIVLANGSSADSITYNNTAHLPSQITVRQNYSLSVSKSGSGVGTVSSNPPGINCGADCSESYAAGTVVALTGSAASGSTFAGWTGDADCSDGVVTMNANRSCTATFNQVTYTLSVARSGSGSGTVTSIPGGIDCGADCSESYAAGAVVALVATASSGSAFAGWTGDADCSDGVVTMSSGRSCTAVFNSATTFHTLAIAKSGSGTGTVTSNPGGIDCGADCSQSYASGTVVTLFAAASSGSAFAGWSGHADCGDGVVTMTSSRSCTATFNAVSPTSFPLNVSRTGTGTGTVTSNPAGIDCGSDCSESYPSGTTVTLTAIPAAGSSFAGWSGDCSGSGSCVVVLDAARSVAASFEVVPGGATCDPDFTLTCGSLDSWANDAPGSTDVISRYACLPFDYPGPEYTYVFDAPADTHVQVLLGGLAADLDLIVLRDTGGGCDAGSCTSHRAVGGTGSELVQFGAVGGHRYYVVVDGYNGAISDYTVQLVCDGATFADVPTGFWAFHQIQAVYNAGVTTGCAQSPRAFCPGSPVTRDQMAAFLVRSQRGRYFTLPAPTGLFADVPASYWAAGWIEQLYRDGVTTGCATGPLRYCPTDNVTRAQMAVFLLRAKHGAGYTPPAATGLFADVTPGYWAAAWIEQLYREGITQGCAASPLRYCPEVSVSRAEMAVFLVRTFGLPLP